MLSQENRPTVQFQSTNGHAQNNSMPSHAAVHNGVGGNSIVFVKCNYSVIIECL